MIRSVFCDDEFTCCTKQQPLFNSLHFRCSVLVGSVRYVYLLDVHVENDVEEACNLSRKLARQIRTLRNLPCHFILLILDVQGHQKVQGQIAVGSHHVSEVILGDTPLTEAGNCFVANFTLVSCDLSCLLHHCSLVILLCLSTRIQDHSTI